MDNSVGVRRDLHAAGMSRRGTSIEILRASFSGEVFTFGDARAVGMPGRRLASLVAAGEVVKVGRGRYMLQAPATSQREKYLHRLKAICINRPGVALAGVSAAAAWSLPCPDPWGDWTALPITICTAGRVQQPRQGLTIITAGTRTFTEASGLPVTDLATTAADVAWQLPAPQALIVIDAIARRLVGSTDRRLLSGARARHGARDRLLLALEDVARWPGVRAARRTLAWADPAADSPPESYIRGHILLAGLPHPIVNAPVHGASGRQYYADLYWPDSRRGVEVDGKIKYDSRDVIFQEKLRHDDLRVGGTELTRWTAVEIFDHPQLLVAELGGFLA